MGRNTKQEQSKGEQQHNRMAQTWIMIISELHRYQGVRYKSDITVISGLDPGDRQVLEHKYIGCDPPCLLDSSDGRFVLKGAAYNPMDVMNCLMIRRGYKMQGLPQQRTLPNIHNKDDKCALIYHLAKEAAFKRAHTIAGGQTVRYYLWWDIISGGTFSMVEHFLWWDIFYGGILSLVGHFLWWDIISGGALSLVG